MAFCAKCGAQLAAGATFCTACGAAQSASSAGGGAAAPAAGTGLDENVAGLLSYVFGWVTGLIFFLIDKRPFVRFHAAQAMVTFGAICVLYILLAMFVGASVMIGVGMIGTLITVAMYPLIGLASLIAWIMCMVKAYGGERFKLPFIGDLAEKFAGK
jgi:uncharacterized membrane protein